MKSIAEQVSSIPLFEGLPPDQIEALFRISSENNYGRGENIFSEGEEGSGFYVVGTGRIKVFKMSPEGREQILHIFGPGEVFGEVPVFAGKRFPASAETMEKSLILFFPRDALLSLIEKNPAIALNMLAVLSMRLRRFTSMIDDLSLKEVPGRLAKHFLYLDEHGKGNGHLELNITKGQLASLLGTIPETLSRILARMADQELIGLEGKRVKILDREGIEELAEGFRRLQYI